ncbi:MAG: ATP-binding cassette domain-containing protein [Steroidobacteraceae bacterium]
MTTSLRLFLRANARHLTGMLGASLLVNLFALAMPLFAMLVYDKAMGNAVHDTLWALAIGMALLLAQETALRLSRVQLVEHAGARWDAFLDERLMRGVLNAPLSRQIRIADLINRLREFGATREVLSAQSLLPLADLPFLLLFMAVVALIGGWLLLIPVLVGAAVLGLSLLCHRLSHERQGMARQATDAKLSTLVDVLSARDSLVGQSRATIAEALYRSHAQAAARAGARARWWQQTLQQIVPVLVSVASIAMLVGGVYRVEAQAMSVGGVISTNLIGTRILGMLCGLAPFVTRWREFLQSLTALGDTVDLKVPARVGRVEAATPDALILEGVRFESICFTYPGTERPVLDGLDLHLRSDEVVAVVGASGAGKSTLLRLVAGQFAPARGRLTCAGHLIDSDEARRWLNQQVTFKTQDSGFLGGSVRDIVSGGLPASDASLITALRTAGLGSALDAGELGLNSLVGTNGAGLSGGQRQMLALAAAFHSPRSLVVLDEPTLGLDRAAQESVLAALRPLRTGRCVVIATHAAEVIAQADRVIVLERGRVKVDAPAHSLIQPPARMPVPDGAAALRAVGGNS